MNNREYFLKKLLFRSTHRGTKEMDLFLGGFLKENITTLKDDELKEFEQILNFSDKNINDWLVFNKKNDEIDAIALSKKLKLHVIK